MKAGGPDAAAQSPSGATCKSSSWGEIDANPNCSSFRSPPGGGRGPAAQIAARFWHCAMRAARCWWSARSWTNCLKSATGCMWWPRPPPLRGACRGHGGAHRRVDEWPVACRCAGAHLAQGRTQTAGEAQHVQAGTAPPGVSPVDLRLAAAGAGCDGADWYGPVHGAGQSTRRRGLQVFFWEPIKSQYALGELMVKATPLLLIALGLAVCFRPNRPGTSALRGSLVIGAVVAAAPRCWPTNHRAGWISPPSAGWGVGRHGRGRAHGVLRDRSMPTKFWSA